MPKKNLNGRKIKLISLLDNCNIKKVMFSILTVCRHLRSLHLMTQSYFSNVLVLVEGMALNCEQIRNLILKEISVCLPEWSAVEIGVSGLVCTPSTVWGFTGKEQISQSLLQVTWESIFVCRGDVGSVVQKNLQVLIEFYVQLWSHFLWLILHHFFE